MQTATGTDAAALFGDFFGRIDAAIALIAEAMRPAIARVEAFLQRMNAAHGEALSRAGVSEAARQSCRNGPAKPASCATESAGELRSNAQDRRSPRGLKMLTPALSEVWSSLDGEVFTAKDVANKIGKGVTEGHVHKRIQRLKAAGYRIENTRGLGYWRPDRPPPTGGFD